MEKKNINAGKKKRVVFMQLDSVVERQIANASEDPPELTAINISTFTGCCRCVGIDHATESRRRRCGKTSGERANGRGGRDEHPVHLCSFLPF